MSGSNRTLPCFDSWMHKDSQASRTCHIEEKVKDKTGAV